jgi:hypothetical protein
LVLDSGKDEGGGRKRDARHPPCEPRASVQNEDIAREILFFMAEEVRSGIREDFMKSKFFGHALDEATAKTKNQHVIREGTSHTSSRVDGRLE